MSDCFCFEHRVFIHDFFIATNKLFIMEKYIIALPYDSAEEEKMIKEVLKLENCMEISWDKTKNLDGTTVCQILGDIEHLITLIGSIASIVSLCEKRVKIYDGNNKLIKQNIKLKNLAEFFKGLKKGK